MKSLYRPVLTTLMALVLSASAMAGQPAPRFIMINGQMMELKPMTSDVKTKNCTVCTKCVLKLSNGKVVKLHDGDCVAADGTRMSPNALHLHGG